MSDRAKKVRPHYTPEEHHMIKCMFRKGCNDAEIAIELCRKKGRTVQAEAVRKIRRKLGLKKVPTYTQYFWSENRYDVKSAGTTETSGRV